MDTIHVGIVGLGANTRLRHVPGLRDCPDVEIVGVCNRRAESTQAAASEFGIPKTYDRWESLVSDPQIDAVVIGTWPYLHCPITLAALESDKHVLTEARMATNAAEAQRMLAASQQHPDLVTQIVPSPMGFRSGQTIKQLLAKGFIGRLREAVVISGHDQVADPNQPRHWRQSAEYSGLNMLDLGILHETLIRWLPDPLEVLAQTHIFTPRRSAPESDHSVDVETPDAVRVMTRLPGGAVGLYHLNGAIYHGPGRQIHLYGNEGTLKCCLGSEEVLLGARHDERRLRELEIPENLQQPWRVEEEFINAIRGLEEVRLTDFETGVRYMQFTEAVVRSAECGQTISLPL